MALDMTLIRAVDARSQAEKVSDETQSIMLQEAMIEINKAVKHGKFSCTMYSLSLPICARLKNLGYFIQTIESVDSYQPSYTTISW